MGEVDEITAQNIRLNEYIRQYAVIQNIGDTVYYTPCTDCTCTLDVFDSTNTQLLNDVQTIELSTGLFGYTATSQYFMANNDYHAVFNCTSVVYGSGLVTSTVHIDEGMPMGSIEVGTSSGGVLDTLIPDLPTGYWDNFWGDFWENLEDFFFGDLPSDYLEKWWDNIKNSEKTGIIGGLTGILNYLASIIVDVVEFVGIVSAHFFDAFRNPEKFMKDMWEYNLELIYLVVTLSSPFFIVFMFVELWFISQSLDKDFFGMVGKFMTLNMQMVGFIYVALNFVLNFLIQIFNVFITLISSIRALFPF